MTFSRRSFSIGLIANAINLLAPSLKAAGLVSVSRAALDLALDDPWLIRRKGRASVFVLHEPTGAMFRPGASDELTYAGVWADYAPPYMLAIRNARGELVQIAPPAMKRPLPDGRAPGTADLLCAVRRVAKISAAGNNGADLWLMARPSLAGGNEITVAPASGFAGHEGLSFPSELRAKIAQFAA
jgi:hypothetical protein